MRFAALLIVALVGCSSNGSSADAPLGSSPDAGLAQADAPRADGTANPGVDGGAADAASTLGRFCVTSADGGPGTCSAGEVCCASGTTICTLPSDCPAGPGYKSCNASSECQGSICCRLSDTVKFCTKQNVCAAYGGTQI